MKTRQKNGQKYESSGKKLIEKRRIEKQNLKNFKRDEIRFKISGKDVPIEIMDLVVSFLKKNLAFLNSFGLVDENFYLFALTCFKSIKIHKKEVLKIPILVLQSLRTIDFSCYIFLTSKNINYILENSKNSLTHIKLRGNYNIFLSAIDGKKEIIENLTKLTLELLGGYPEQTYEKIELDWITKYFPNLKKLILEKFRIDSYEGLQIDLKTSKPLKLQELKIMFTIDRIEDLKKLKQDIDMAVLRKLDLKLGTIFNLPHYSGFLKDLKKIEELKLEFCSINNPFGNDLEKMKIFLNSFKFINELNNLELLKMKIWDDESSSEIQQFFEFSKKQNNLSKDKVIEAIQERISST